jgi:hypothetical protein
MENLLADLANFKIGEKVTWKVGNIEVRGAVLESEDEYTHVQCHYIAGRRDLREIKVPTNFLKLDI